MSKARELAELGNVYSDGALSNRNLIINGAMQVAQRGPSFTNTAGYQLDRWAVGNPGTNSVSQQFSTTLGMYYMDVTTSAGWGTYQWVESVNVRHLKAGDTVTVSYWTNVTSGNFNIKTTNTSSVGYSTATIDTASGWYRRSAVVTISSGQASDIASGGHLRLAIEPAVNSFYLTGVQLEVGDTATPFEHRSVGQELALCERYLQTLPVGGSAYSAIVGYDGSIAVINLRQTMRASPSLLPTGITGYGSGSTEYRVYVMSNGGGGFIGSPVTANFYIDYSTPTKVRIICSHASGWYNSSFEHTGSLIEVGAGCKVLLEAEL